MKKIFIVLLSQLVLFIFPSKVMAVVYINEISPSTNPEWVEIYNDSATSVDLSGYKLEDGNSATTDDLTLSGIISGNGFVVFSHSEGWLNNSGDTVKLYNNASPSAIIDQYTFGSVNSSESVARIPNGGSWQGTGNVTQNASNPTPTPAPSATPSPTPTPTPTKTPTPTPVKTKTPTPSPSLTPEVLGETTATPANIEAMRSALTTDAPTPTSTTGSHGPFPVFAVVFIGAGILVTFTAMFLIFKQKKSESLGPQ